MGLFGGGTDLMVRLGLDDSLFNSKLGSAERRLGGFGAGIQRHAKIAAAAMGAAFAGAAALSVKAAIEVETAWAGVLKTVDGTSEELAKLRGELLAMGSEVPLSTTAIMGIAESAGQLGIAVNDVAAFTKTMADLGATTNLSGEQAAMTIARIANVSGLATSDVDRFGSALVALGNNSATTEAEILDMTGQFAGSAAAAGMSETTMLALAAALSEVGVRGQEGGTSVDKALQMIGKAVREGGEDMELFAAVSGMSASEFAHAWEMDAGGAVATFIAGLGRFNQAGGDSNVVLDKLGITNVRLRKAFLNSAGAGDAMARSIELSNHAWVENTALAAEAEKRYETTAAQIQMLKNDTQKMALVWGEALLPAAKALVAGLRNLAVAGMKVSEFVKKFAPLIVGLTFTLGALTAVTAIYMKAQTALGVVTVAQAVKTAILTAATSAYAIATGIATFATNALKVALGPIGWLITGVGAAIGAIVWAFQNWDTIVRKVTEAFTWLLDKLGITEDVMGFLEAATDAISNAWEWAKSKAREFTGGLEEVEAASDAVSVSYQEQQHEINRMIRQSEEFRQSQDELIAVEEALADRADKTREALANQEAVTREKSETTQEFSARLAEAGENETILAALVDDTVDSYKRQHDGTILLHNKTGDLIAAFSDTGGILVDITESYEDLEESTKSATSATERQADALREVASASDLVRAAQDRMSAGQIVSEFANASGGGVPRVRGADGQEFYVLPTQGGGYTLANVDTGEHHYSLSGDAAAQRLGMDIPTFENTMVGAFQRAMMNPTGPSQAAPPPEAAPSRPSGDTLARFGDVEIISGAAGIYAFKPGRGYHMAQTADQFHAWLAGQALPFARGGFVKGPTLGLVGEDGPEMVVPLSKGMSGMSPAARQFVEALAGSNGGGKRAGNVFHVGPIYANDPEEASRVLERKLRRFGMG